MDYPTGSSTVLLYPFTWMLSPWASRKLAHHYSSVSECGAGRKREEAKWGSVGSLLFPRIAQITYNHNSLGGTWSHDDSWSHDDD